MEKCEVGERAIMKFRGALVDALCEIAPDACTDCAACENRKKALHANILRLLCSMLKAVLLHYKFFAADIKKLDCKIDPYNPCITNNHTN